jgi:ABC-type Fe3+-hydroxamate transport system substrate-binding protein
MTFNQRSIEEILEMILTLGRIVGGEEKARALVASFQTEVNAIRNNHIYEVKSAHILPPGPAALTEGLRQLHAILAYAVNQQVDQALLPKEKTDTFLGLPRPEKLVEKVAASYE